MSSYCFLDRRDSSCLECPEMAAEAPEAHLPPAGMHHAIFKCIFSQLFQIFLYYSKVVDYLLAFSYNS